MLACYANGAMDGRWGKKGCDKRMDAVSQADGAVQTKASEVRVTPHSKGRKTEG